MWPVSCAITPITWPALSARIRRPVLMNRFWPCATKALSERSLTRMMWIELGCSPAAFQSGVPNVRMIPSTSVSRIKERRSPSCARTGVTGVAAAIAPATMVATTRLNKDSSPLRLHLTKRRSRRRQLGPAAALAAVALACLTACGGDLLGRNRTVGYLGGVVADEPHAALVGREVLVGGGTAGDAAVATYFALSATLPSTAGLGGGGVCVGYDPDRKRMETIEFLPRPTKGGGMAVPANVRGMALLHARFGHLPWTQLLAPAEQLARIGTEVSRAFANDLSQP